ncbi:MAG: phosphoglycerate dehydrogenase [Bacteroidia bacterium]|nr:phosphoglycerate dehydrogenase [Bacteroidia bacterium]MDW8301179.1 NAD(P)-dependent oxidoreductase [Bacteroidia bacterium]
MKVLIVDDLHPILMDVLSHHGFVCKYVPNMSYQALLCEISEYEGIVMRSHTPIDKAVLNKAVNLKFIAKVGSGIDNIDEAECRKRNIHIINAPEGNRDAVAEFTVGVLLSLARNICTANEEVKRLEWNRELNRGFELKGKTIGIIGYGNVGYALSQRLHGFEMRILAYDKYKTYFSNRYVKEATLEELYEQADIITFHVPLTPETEGWINLEWLMRFKKSIVLLNMARGKIAVLEDLLKGLEIGKIAALGLDVLPNEEFSTYTQREKEILQRIAAFPNVILTPHIAGWSYTSKVKLSEVLAYKILKIKSLQS